MRYLAKVSRLLRILLHNPVEFRDRVMTVVQCNWDRVWPKNTQYDMLDATEAGARLQEALQTNITEFDREKRLVDYENQILSRIEDLRNEEPFTLKHNADDSLARFCDFVCRALAPAVVLETGVAYGVTTSFILNALAVNGKGELWSVDLPPLAQQADRYVGILIPEELKSRWHLCRGTAKRILPKLLVSIQPVDIFVHDSLHTYKNMKCEFEAVWPFLRSGGVLMADDVNENCAFEELAEKVTPVFHAVVRGVKKNSAFGIMVKGG